MKSGVLVLMWLLVNLQRKQLFSIYLWRPAQIESFVQFIGLFILPAIILPICNLLCRLVLGTSQDRLKNTASITLYRGMMCVDTTSLQHGNYVYDTVTSPSSHGGDVKSFSGGDHNECHPAMKLWNVSPGPSHRAPSQCLIASAPWRSTTTPAATPSPTRGHAPLLHTPSTHTAHLTSCSLPHFTFELTHGIMFYFIPRALLSSSLPLRTNRIQIPRMSDILRW